MKKLVVLLLFCLQMVGQETIKIDSITKSNLILFSEGYFGLAGSNRSGLGFAGLNVNYQFNKKDLITARYTGFAGGKSSWFLFLPFFVESESRHEFALLYGKRWINSGSSWSISSGASITNAIYYQNNINLNKNIDEVYFGVPLEINVKWFKANKSRFRAYYGLIPIGKKKVAFGRSVGFKLIGNFGKNNYVGLAFTYGFGFHKKY